MVEPGSGTRMGTGWAVASTTLLGACAAIGLGAQGPLLFATPFYVMAFAALAAFACWSYAMVRAVHGGKGALVAVLVYDLGVALCVAALHVRERPVAAPEAWWAWIVLALSAAAAASVVAELRRRRGRVEGGTAFALSAAFVPVAAWTLLRLS